MKAKDVRILTLERAEISRVDYHNKKELVKCDTNGKYRRQEGQ